MSPSKLPNEIADASSTMQAPDAVKKVGSSDLSNSPIDTPLLTSKLDPSASPFRSFHDSQNSNPFFESTYPSQKLRMRVREEDVPNDPYSSPPPTFLPPESTESIEDKDSSAGLSGGSRNPRSASSREYTGITLVSGQLGSLNTYGVFGPSTSVTGKSVSGYDKLDCIKRGDRKLQSLARTGVLIDDRGSDTYHKSASQEKMPRARYQSPKVDESPFSSDAEIDLTGGVALRTSDDITQSKLQHQTHTFAQLAAEQGIREWNNSVFDNRWLLQPEEMWNTDARRESILTISPERQPTDHKELREVLLASQFTETARESISQQKTIDDLHRQVEELTSKLRERPVLADPSKAPIVGGRAKAMPNHMSRERSMESWYCDQELVPEPLEVGRLDTCIQELLTGRSTLPTRLPYSKNTIREFFWDRVFPGVDWPTRLRGEEGSRMTWAFGSVTTLEAVRDQVLNRIEEIVNFMASPAKPIFHEQKKGLPANEQYFGDELAQTLPASRPVNDQAFKNRIDSFEDRSCDYAQIKSRGENLSSRLLPLDQRRNLKSSTSIDHALSHGKLRIIKDVEVPEGSPTPRQHTVREHALGVGLDNEQNTPPMKSRAPVCEAKVAQPTPMPFAYGVPSQHLTFGGYPLPMYTAPPYGAQMVAAQNPWTVPQSTYAAYSAMPYGNPWQQAYAQSPVAYGQPPVAAYTPPPMPNAYTFARPAATNRVARMFAPTNTFQPAESQASPRSQNTEWQNRFIIPPTVVPDVPVLPYRVGSDDMYPQTTGAASARFQNLTRTDPISLDLAIAEDNVPFAENARLAKPPQWGVMKIGNIPYDLTKAQILSFLGPHAKTITTDLGPSIHIIMDRSTGKTMDCYIEFYSKPDARACVNSLGHRPHGHNRIGDRVIDIHLSSQEELLKELFPKAKSVSWEDGRPKVLESNEMFNSGFKTFVSAEELGNIVRHAEQPHRSNYTQRSPQRTYEALISLLAKFPWYDVSHYTLATRNQIFQATRTMLHILSINLRRAYSTPTSSDSPLSMYSSPHKHRLSASFGGTPLLTEQLLKDLLMAGLNASGFSEKQRWSLFQMSEYARHHFRMSPLLQYWPWEVLCRKTHMEEDIVELYANLIANHPVTRVTGNPFGSLDRLVATIDFESQTMDQIGEMESKIFYAMIPGGITGDMGEEMEKALAS